MKYILILIVLIASHWFVYQLGEHDIYKAVPIYENVLEKAIVYYKVDTIGYDGDWFCVKDGKRVPIMNDGFYEYIWSVK